MTDNSSSAATTLSIVGTIFWCIQLIPQIVYNYRRKDCTGLPVAMMFLWAASGVPFGVYFIVQRAITALQIQPQLFMFFCLVAFWQTLYYPPVNLGFKKATLIVGVQALLSAGIEVALILPLRNLYDKGTHWPNLIPGIIAAVLLAVGLLPPYPELWKAKGQVVGINFVFLFMDSTGAVLSLASVCVQTDDFDTLGAVLYAIVFALELGIFTSHIVWMIRVKHFGLVPIAVENGDSDFDDKSVMPEDMPPISRGQKVINYLFGEIKPVPKDKEISESDEVTV